MDGGVASRRGERRMRPGSRPLCRYNPLTATCVAPICPLDTLVAVLASRGELVGHPMYDRRGGRGV